MAKRKGLGRGLGALIPEKKGNTKSLDQVEYINLKDIIPSEDNPRKTFDEQNIKNLADSIKTYGIIQPLVLIQDKDKYNIVAGERRFRAASYLGLEQVPAIVKNLTKKDKDIISVIENIQREDLNPFEEAMAYSNVMDKYSLTQLDLSNMIGKSRTYVANIVRLTKLDERSIKELEHGNITSSQGRALLSISDISERHKYLDMLIKDEITVNDLERKKSKRRSKSKQKDIFISDLEDRLKESLGAKVNINKTKNKWDVKIEFASDEQIEDFLERYE